MRFITTLIVFVVLTVTTVRTNETEAPSEAEIAFFLQLAAAEEEALILAQFQKTSHEASITTDKLETEDETTNSMQTLVQNQREDPTLPLQIGQISQNR